MFKMNVPGAEGMVCNFDITQQGAEKVTLHRFLMAAAATLFLMAKASKKMLDPVTLTFRMNMCLKLFFSRLPE